MTASIECLLTYTVTCCVCGAKEVTSQRLAPGVEIQSPCLPSKWRITLGVPYCPKHTIVTESYVDGKKASWVSTVDGNWKLKLEEKPLTKPQVTT